MNTRTHAELANVHLEHLQPAARPLQAQRVPQGHPPPHRAPTLRLRARRDEGDRARRRRGVREAIARTFGQSCLSGPPGRPFYNTSRLDFGRLLDDPNNIAQNLSRYIRDFSDNVFEIMQRFGFDEHIARMNERNLLYQVIQQFANVDLSPARVDNVQMGYVFEELIRVGAEQANEEAGEHFTPREVIRLMVSLLLSPEPDLGTSFKVKTIYDPACGTGGMLSESPRTTCASTTARRLPHPLRAGRGTTRRGRCAGRTC